MTFGFREIQDISVYKSDVTIEEIKLVFEQLIGALIDTPYSVYLDRWYEDLVNIRDFVVENKYPYVDFLLSHFVLYDTKDPNFPYPYPGTIIRSPYRSKVYEDWLSKNRLGLKDFSLYFFNTKLYALASLDKDFISGIKSYTENTTQISLTDYFSSVNELRYVTHAFLLDYLGKFFDENYRMYLFVIRSYLVDTLMFGQLKILYGV